MGMGMGMGAYLGVGACPGDYGMIVYNTRALSVEHIPCALHLHPAVHLSAQR